MENVLCDMNVSVMFGVNLPTKGYIPLTDFYKILHGEGLPGSHPHTKFYHFGLVNVGLQPKKLPKIVIFGINLLKSMRKSKNRYFYHILVSPGDAPGAITLNFWSVREFDAYKLSPCMCPSNYNRL